MAVSKRERLVAIGAAAAAGLFILNSFVLTPYIDERHSIETKLVDLSSQENDADRLLHRRSALQKVYHEMLAHGLESDVGQSQYQAQVALLEWAKTVGVEVQTLRPGRSPDDKNFVASTYDMTAKGSTPSIARLLWALEHPTIPLRVTEIQISSEKEGTDDLKMTVGVTTIATKPDASGKDTLASAAGMSGVRP